MAPYLLEPTIFRYRNKFAMQNEAKEMVFDDKNQRNDFTLDMYRSGADQLLVGGCIH
jgi:hypothetical protein